MRVIRSTLTETSASAMKRLSILQSFGDPERICFLDIETTGFSRTYDTIYLVGLMFTEGAQTVTEQYLIQSQREEPDMLRRVLDRLRDFEAIVTYNGDMFDLPFLQERAKRYRLYTAQDQEWFQHRIFVDLMRRYRPYQRFFGWPSMKLKVVEACLGTSRQDPFDGGMLIEVFYEYERTDDPRLEKTLLLHNYEDIIDLRQLLRVDELLLALFEGKACSAKLENGIIKVEWSCQIPITHEARITYRTKDKKDPAAPAFLLQTEAARAYLQIKLHQREEPRKPLWYYLSNPADYYYLSETEEIVHRSLSDDIPASMRKKAKPEQCKLKAPNGKYYQIIDYSEAVQEGSSFEDRPFPIYKEDRKAKEEYGEEKELARFIEAADEDTLTAMVQAYLSKIR